MRYALSTIAQACGRLRRLLSRAKVLRNANNTAVLVARQFRLHTIPLSSTEVRTTSNQFTSAMPVSLLTLPYELREQILACLLCKKSSIKLQHTTECKAALKLPISQVCRLLREEAIRLFCQVNTFTLTIDPEAVSY